MYFFNQNLTNIDFLLDVRYQDLTSIDPSNNQIKDITALSKLTSLEWLNLENNQIKDLLS